MFTLLHYKGARNVVVAVVLNFSLSFFKKRAVKAPEIVYGNGAPNHMQEWQIIDHLLPLPPPSQSK